MTEPAAEQQRRTASAIDEVLRWVVGLGEDPTKARIDAMWLADQASRALDTAITPDDVARHWPGGTPRGDLAIIEQLVESWEIGTAAPSTVLATIRDLLARRDPARGAR